MSKAIQFSRQVVVHRHRQSSQFLPSAWYLTTKRYKREVPEGPILDQILEDSKSGRNESTIPEYPGWSETLASDSEATVKADRSPSKSIRTLQEETIQVFEKKKVKKQYPMND